MNNYYGMNDWRTRRNLLNHHFNASNQNFSSRHYSNINYSTEEKNKTDMKNTLSDDMFLNNLHMIKDPLKKNLADTLVTEEIKFKAKMGPQADYENDQSNQNNRRDYYPSLAGIGSFISGVFNVISGAMFHKRAKSPVTQYHDCFDNSVHEESPALECWQPSKIEVENKNGRAHEQFNSPTDNSDTDVTTSTMTSECRSVATHCESKINQVRLLLSSKNAPTVPKFRRRPRRLFIEPGSVEETFEDAFAPEDFEKLANDIYIHCVSPYNCQNQELLEVDAPKMKTEYEALEENMEIVKSLPEIKEDIEPKKSAIATHKLPAILEATQQEIIQNIIITEKSEPKQEIVSSCEDKLGKLKALLLERRKKNTKATTNCSDYMMESAKVDDRLKTRSKPVPTLNVQDKHFKNPHRMSTGKRKKTQMLKDIQDDMSFADEIHCDELPSVENSPSTKSIESRLSSSSTEDLDYFNEVTGRFHSSSTTESDDCFQIVFNDSLPIPRPRKISDCDSEDSFIVFEESPDSCYTSNDVFGYMSHTDGSDSDTDSDISDSGCGSSKLTHSFSKTYGDLTDDSLYEEDMLKKQDSKDQIDSAVQIVCEELSAVTLGDLSEVNDSCVVKSKGLLLDERRKKLRKQQPPKKVQFSPMPPKVHVMRVWTFAARQARAGDWERLALDRERFKRRIADVDMAVSWVLKPQHRTRIMFQRFMPWWNAQKRKELAEKKAKEEQRKAEKVIVDLTDPINKVVDNTISTSTDEIVNEVRNCENVDISQDNRIKGNIVVDNKQNSVIKTVGNDDEAISIGNGETVNKNRNCVDIVKRQNGRIKGNIIGDNKNNTVIKTVGKDSKAISTGNGKIVNEVKNCKNIDKSQDNRIKSVIRDDKKQNTGIKAVENGDEAISIGNGIINNKIRNCVDIDNRRNDRINVRGNKDEHNAKQSKA